MCRIPLRQAYERAPLIAAVCLFAYALLHPCAAHALSSDKALRQFAVASWQNEAGLPELAIQALLETSDGYLWVGTQEGLARFDGQYYSVFDHVDTPQLSSDFVTALAEDAQHNLWIGTAEGLVMRSRDGRFRTVGRDAGLRITRVLAAVRDGDGSVWIAGAGGVAHLVDGHVERSLGTDDGIESDLVTSLALDREGALWILAKGRLHRFKDGKVEKYIPDRETEGQDIVNLFAVGKGQVWALGSESTIFIVGDGRFEAWWPPGVPRSEHLLDVHEDRDGSIWFATNTHGLFRLRSRAAIAAEQGFSEQRIQTLYEDSAGNLWVGTLGRGLIRLSDRSFETIATADGLASDSALTVLADRKNDVWIGTLNGLTRLRGDAARQFSTADGLTSDYVASLAASFDGGLWLGLRGNVVDHLREGRVDRHIALKPPLLSSVVTALIEDERHQLWIGTNGAGVAQYASDGLHYFTNGDGLAENSINTIAPDRGDAVWVGTANGLWRIDAGRVDANPLHDARTAHLSILAVYEDGAGVLWLGTQAHGLLRVDRGALTFYGREQGLPNDTINSILGDESGNLWLGSNRGVLRLAREQIDAVAAGRRDRFDVMQFGEGDGMKTAETSSGSQPSAWRGSDGRLWFVSGVGVVVADPKRIRRDTRALRPLIESVRADDAAVDFSDAELRLPAGLARLEIHYTAPNLTAANSMRFRYRLSDFDDSWSYVGNERVARYVNLPPGAHRFDLQVRRADEDWSAAGESLRFYVEPAFYETNTFLVLAVLSAIAVLWTLYYLRVQWLRMESAVADERRRLAGEIHDSLAQGFSAISVQIEAALGRMQRAPELAVTHLKLASDVSRSSLSEARRSIWNLQARSSDAGGMAAMIDAACEQILYGHDTRLHVAMHGKPWRANPSIEHNLVRIAQEAVANAIQHGRAREISTELRYDFARLTLSIRDDGIGYDGGAPRPAEGDRGYGLQNMRLRAHAMHGELSIQSAPGVGTRIDVVVPRVAFLRLAQRRSGAVR